MKNPIIPINNPDVDEAKFGGAMLAMREQHASVVSLANQIGYQLPGGGVDADLIQRDISANMRRSVEACLEVGRGLCVLKEICLHGEFMSRLEVLQIETRVAQRFMLAVTKFSKAATSPLLKAAKNQSKLFELLVLEDDEIKELEGGGSVSGLTLDDVETMGVRELRAALRESRKEKVAVEQRLEVVRKQREDAEAAATIIKTAPPEEFVDRLQKESSAAVGDAVGAVRGRVRGALVAIQQAPDHPAKEVLMAALVGQVQAELNALRNEFNLPDVSSAADQALAAEVAEWAK